MPHLFSLWYMYFVALFLGAAAGLLEAPEGALAAGRFMDAGALAFGLGVPSVASGCSSTSCLGSFGSFSFFMGNFSLVSFSAVAFGFGLDFTAAVLAAAAVLATGFSGGFLFHHHHRLTKRLRFEMAWLLVAGRQLITTVKLLRSSQNYAQLDTHRNSSDATSIVLCSHNRDSKTSPNATNLFPPFLGAVTYEQS